MSAAVDLVQQSFNGAELLAAFTRDADDAGAVVSFIGLARRRSREGEAVAELVLQSYRGATLRSMQDIAAEALSRFDITRCRVVHRDGTIKPGEAIVFVATASRHRRAAFEAADYLMDRLKTEAVFWKREEGPGGSRWIEPTEGDRADAERWA